MTTTETTKESLITKIEIDAEKLWSWFEREIGLEHPAAKSLNAIAPKPTPVSSTPESNGATGNAPASETSESLSGSSSISIPQASSASSVAGSSSIEGAV